jgi:hypothetical protein
MLTKWMANTINLENSAGPGSTLQEWEVGTREFSNFHGCHNWYQNDAELPGRSVREGTASLSRFKRENQAERTGEKKNIGNNETW